MKSDGSPEHLTWDGLIEEESEEIKSEAVNAPPPPSPEPNGFAPLPTRWPAKFRESKLDPRRLERIRMAALHALERRRNGSAPPIGQTHFEPGIDPFTLNFKQPPGLLPPDIRKNLQGNIIPQVSPAMMRQLNWNANIFQTFSRLVIYGFGGLRWAFDILWDKLLRRDTMERRAVRLRETIERIGGSAVKVGQQMAMRIDLLPYEYTVELTKMLDRMPTFPTRYAIERIEVVMGKPLLEVFEAFDPVPIGSASVACVFQAFLKNGDRVAVKVRRPGIGVKFVADCNALAAVLQFLEFFTIIRPGLSRNFVYEFRSMLMEELDFRKEARYTELFRSGVKKHMKHINAPRIYFELSSDDVMVSEFVGGVWMRELIAAVEKNDTQALELLRAEGIHPELVAKRLLRTNQYGVFENVLFHADPHPSNVVIQRNSELVFIDFGSSGAYTTKERNNWRQLSHYHDKADIGRMVQAALAVLEPLPPIDIDEFSKRVEGIFWQDLYAFRSKHTEWWERTSAKIWIRFLTLAREYNIPLNLNTLKMIRSTLLYETIAARLYPEVDAYKEHRIYNNTAGKRARKRVHRQVLKFLFKGPSNENYLAIEQLADMANRTTYLAQRWLDSPPFQFSNLVDKASMAISVCLRALLTFSVTTLGLAFGLVAWRLITKGSHGSAQIGIWQACLEIVMWTPYQFLVGVNLFLDIRKILFRFFDKDIKERNS
jgi:predicted unusual protein kinase regulating ubiquinone biosynthesis (AarF/ABC1/UbiB family)